MHYPLYQEIFYQNPVEVFKAFSAEKGAIFLDSSGCDRYSYILTDPFFLIELKNTTRNPFDELQKELKQFPLSCHEHLPPFQGGIAGFFSYDLGHYLEEIPRALDDMQFPDLAVGFYDVVIAFDDHLKKSWIISSGFPEKSESARKNRALARMQSLFNKINKAVNHETASNNLRCQIESNFSEKTYCEAVVKVQNAILAGDIFEANISQRFRAQLSPGQNLFSIYEKLREINPAPFSAFIYWGDTVIASASPERFLKLTGKNIETRPIKGTRPRSHDAQQDKLFADELLASEKDRAENIMIVDLLRNDLSRVSESHTVEVTQLCGLESFETVHHLVSVIKSNLKKELDAVDLLRATFPGGSITGAPKIKAMEIITEIEKTARGPYCGSIGYIGFNGDMDLSITIRTIAIKNNCITFQAGGAVTIDSDPKEEYAETLVKAHALQRVFS